MPRVAEKRLRESASKPAFPKLFQQLAGDGVRWVQAELALARAEAGKLLGRYIAAIVMALASFAILIAALVILAQACVAALSPYLNGPVAAGFAVSLILLAGVVLLGLATRHLMALPARPAGLIFRCLTGRDARERNSP
jgi:hypothetical protein